MTAAAQDFVVTDEAVTFQTDGSLKIGNASFSPEQLRGLDELGLIEMMDETALTSAEKESVVLIFRLQRAGG